MHALVYHGPGEKAWEEVPEPVIQADSDAIVRADAVTICGTDLHILKGDVPAVTPGRILGHEAVGTVEQVGGGVKTLRPGDKVLVSCITACGGRGCTAPPTSSPSTRPTAAWRRPSSSAPTSW
jgi:alcohol dehydrogenase